jgi:hypothetical protein
MGRPHPKWVMSGLFGWRSLAPDVGSAPRAGHTSALAEQKQMQYSDSEMAPSDPSNVSDAIRVEGYTSFAAAMKCCAASH